MRLLAVGYCTFYLCTVGQGAPTANRTIPPVESPKEGLEFSASPTTQELFRARVFEEPLVPIGGEPSADENAALAGALLGYANRSGPDDFSSLTGFLEKYPQSPWRAALLTGLGSEYYNTAHYSLALEAWEKAWPLAKDATDAKGKAIADRALGELAYMLGRVGRMNELEALLKSIEGREVVGSATERISGVRQALWNMQNRPEVAFRCGPLALQRILLLSESDPAAQETILQSASTQKGCSLSQVAELSKKVGLNYQMAFRQPEGDFVIPSVVHWRMGHYAALVRREGDRYLLQDPTFGNETWATKQTLLTESSGYFLIPSGDLPRNWRVVSNSEGAEVWGKGLTTGNDPAPTGPCDPATPRDPCKGMATFRVHLMPVSLNIVDEPVGYSPPVGPAVPFVVRYGQRDAFQPGVFTYSNFGPKWTCDWISYITDNPQNLSADVKYYIMGGGTRTFTGFNSNSQTFAYQQFDQTKLVRTGANSYELLSRDGSKLVFSQSDGSSGTSRKVFMSQVVDPFGNALTLGYDGNMRLMGITDAIGQTTTLSYTNAGDIYKITHVTDPFGRSASFAYDSLGRLTNITDVIGLNSTFTYDGSGDFISSLITPYGTNTFTQGGTGTTRLLETLFPDGSRERVEFNQNIPQPAAKKTPMGMTVQNDYLTFRNTYYWSRNACSMAYGDYSKAKIYHWLHTSDLVSTAGILESVKEPLEDRVWFEYSGQPAPVIVGDNNRPTHIGRVLDGGFTQLQRYTYDGFGHVLTQTDPIGRKLSYTYDSNGIDLLEIRAGNNDVLARMTYNSQHLPLTRVDAAAQTNTYSYNARGQLLSTTNPEGEITSFDYDTNGYLVRVDGPLPGTNDVSSMTYDSVGRMDTVTSLSGYVVTFSYDNLDRITNVAYPDGTFEGFVYNHLDPVVVLDRAGRQTLLEYDSMRNLTKVTDPLNRSTLLQWCACGQPKSLIDPMGRITTWNRDLQARLTSKVYGDGSQVTYEYEPASSRLLRRIDEKGQISNFTYNRDNTLQSVTYANSQIPTPGVQFTYDPIYRRTSSMTDGIGTTHYAYHPAGSLGALKPSSVDGPWTNDTVTYAYDELGRLTNRAINGVGQSWAYDSAGRMTNNVNVLGSFIFAYDGPTRRISDILYPNGQTTHLDYFGNSGDQRLQQISHRKPDTSLISRFTYAYNPVGNITNWVQELGALNETWSIGYDAADRVSSVVADQGGTNTVTSSYAYDPADNRLSEQVDSSQRTFRYNGLNEMVSASDSISTNRAYEWNAEHRLTAIVSGTNRSEFAYDGQGRLRRVTEKSGLTTISERRFVWSGTTICEERDAGNSVVSRFFAFGERRTGTNLFYVSDHLDSIRALTDDASTIRAEFTYSAFGSKVHVVGNFKSTFGFTRLLNHEPSGNLFAVFRVYRPDSARWLSRDPIGEAGGVNLFRYASQDPINRLDPLGLEDCFGRDSREKLETVGTVASILGIPVDIWALRMGERAGDLLTFGGIFLDVTEAIFTAPEAFQTVEGTIKWSINTGLSGGALVTGLAASAAAPYFAVASIVWSVADLTKDTFIARALTIDIRGIICNNPELRKAWLDEHIMDDVQDSVLEGLRQATGQQ